LYEKTSNSTQILLCQTEGQQGTVKLKRNPVEFAPGRGEVNLGCERVN